MANIRYPQANTPAAPIWHAKQFFAWRNKRGQICSGCGAARLTYPDAPADTLNKL